MPILNLYLSPYERDALKTLLKTELERGERDGTTASPWHGAISAIFAQAAAGQGLQGKWRRRGDGAYVSDAGYVIRRNGPDWSVNRSDTEPIPGFNTHSTLAIAKKRCEQDLSARQGQPSPETRTVKSWGDPGKWQAQYYDRDMNMWFDIGDAQTDRADAQAREQEYADHHAKITGNAQRTRECDGCGGVHPVSTLHHERLVDMGSSESDYRCRVCGPLNHQRITSPTAARRAETQ